MGSTGCGHVLVQVLRRVEGLDFTCSTGVFVIAHGPQGYTLHSRTTKYISLNKFQEVSKNYSCLFLRRFVVVRAKPKITGVLFLRGVTSRRA